MNYLDELKIKTQEKIKERNESKLHHFIVDKLYELLDEAVDLACKEVSTYDEAIKNLERAHLILIYKQTDLLSGTGILERIEAIIFKNIQKRALAQKIKKG